MDTVRTVSIKFTYLLFRTNTIYQIPPHSAGQLTVKYCLNKEASCYVAVDYIVCRVLFRLYIQFNALNVFFFSA